MWCSFPWRTRLPPEPGSGPGRTWTDLDGPGPGPGPEPGPGPGPDGHLPASPRALCGLPCRSLRAQQCPRCGEPGVLGGEAADLRALEARVCQAVRKAGGPVPVGRGGVGARDPYVHHQVNSPVA
ncbi:hypothetical protein E0E62_16445 [Streptomyces sp. 16-176A]